MVKQIRQWLPEAVLALVTVYFCFRELGTFPAPWVDEGLFLQVARNVAAGRGYGLQVLTYFWPAPYILGVGPTLILPSALTLRIFGDSVAAARAASAGITVLVGILFYVYCRTISGRRNALYATALLVSLSAFINTGKTVLGEVPAFGFLLLGLLALERSATKKHAVLAGVFLGLAAVTKITYGIILPALFLAWISEILMRRKKNAYTLLLIALPATLLFFAWQFIEYASRPGGFQELVRYGFAAGGEGLFPVLRSDPHTLLRFPFVYFGALFLLFLIGKRRGQLSIAPVTRIFIPAFIVLFMLYFLNGPIWYRHLLPAHMMLLPFVPIGLFAILPRRIAIATICFFVLAQGWWQFDHRGSTPSGEASGAAQNILTNYTHTSMVISAPDLYVLLPEVPQRLFLSEEVLGRDFRMFPDLPVLPEEHCLPWVRKLGWDEQKALGDRVTTLYRRYVMIAPPAECNHGGL